MTPDLADCLGTRETATLEFKERISDRNAVCKTICALANDQSDHGGGDLLIGVRDDATAKEDADTSDEALLKISNMRDHGRILDRPSMWVERAQYRGKPVIRVHVEAARTPPVRFDGIIWVRPGPTTRQASRDDERILTERRRTFERPFDTHPIRSAALDDLDLERFRSTYLPAAMDVSVLEENDRSVEYQLASLGLADIETVPTVLGLLLLGYDPTNFLPGAYLQFARFAGTDLDSPVIDEQELRQNIVDIATQLEALLRGHLHAQLVETSGFREEKPPDYPMEALRECCMNAIMHRNYMSSNASVRIFWFSDRVEIANPGGPYGQVRTDNFAQVNDYRNPSLAGAMKTLGYVNRFGRGIRRIYAALEKNGNPRPEFSFNEASWSVTLRSAT